MASIRLLRNRIRSARNIAQITKAMELVAASKMKKAQAAAQAGKYYARKIHDMVMELAHKSNPEQHPLLKRPENMSGKRLVVVISSNKGLSGGLYANLFRFLITAYPDPRKNDYISLGRKGADFLVKVGCRLVADFSDGTSFVGLVPAIIELVVRNFLEGDYDGVDIVFSEFHSALRQVPVKRTVLPLTIDMAQSEKQDAKTPEFLVEPSVDEVFESLLPHYVENQVRDAVLQAEASEHSARMVAMRNATDNANQLISDFTLMYNKARQEKITNEILDIVTARVAVE